jgi:DNA-binding transcriptional regulator GbsR (MarR family)
MRIRRMTDGSFCDEQSGEVLNEEKYVFLAVPVRTKIKEDWFMAFQDAFEELAKDKRLWGQPTAVLHLLMSRLSFENFIALEQSDIAKELKIERPRVSEAMKKLVDRGIVEKGPRLGKSCSYKLNPFYGWKGRVKSLQEERKKRLKSIKGGKED